MNLLKNHKTLILSILTIALPAVIEMSLNTLVGIADTLMIGRMIGKEGLSAAGFANQLIFTLIFIFASFNTGATAMISRSYGEKNYEKLNKVAGQNLSLNILIGIIIATFSILFADKALGIYDISQEVFELCRSYFTIVSYSIPFMFISFSCAASLRGAGDTKTPMYVTGITNVLNVIGNYILIKGVWIFPTLGIAGAALSTTISRGIGVVIYLYVCFKGKNHIKLVLSNLKIQYDLLKPLWQLSYPGAIEQFLMQISFLAAGVIVSQLDTDSEAAFRILLNIESLSFMPAVGLSIAAATLVGKALGEEDVDKALKTGYTATGLGIAWGIFMGIIFFAFPTFLVGIFTKDMPIILGSVLAMRVAGFNQPPLNFMIILSGALRGAGDTRAVMIISALRLWIMFVPLSYVFIILLRAGVAGMWFAEITSFSVFCYITFKRFHSKKWAEIRF